MLGVAAQNRVEKVVRGRESGIVITQSLPHQAALIVSDQGKNKEIAHTGNLVKFQASYISSM